MSYALLGKDILRGKKERASSATILENLCYSEEPPTSFFDS